MIAFLQIPFSLFIQRNLQDPINAVLGYNTWQAHGNAIHSILAGYHRGHRNHGFFITNDTSDQTAGT